MNTYTLNNIDLGSFGFIAGKQAGSNIALSGAFDMPPRTGKTFQSWGDDYGVEPYVSATEISFGGRTISLVGYLYGAGKLDCTYKADKLFSLINGFSGLVPLSSKWGTHQVQVNQAVTGDFIGDKVLKMTFNFFEPIVTMSGNIPAGTGAEYGIDGISFRDLGGVLLLLTGDRASRPAPKSLSFTSKTEGLAEIKTEAREMTLKLFIDQADLTSFKAKIEKLCMLFAAPGLRKLSIPTDLNRQFFVKDGFKVSNINSQPNRMTGILECKITESGVLESYANLVDNTGQKITSGLNNLIKIRI